MDLVRHVPGDAPGPPGAQLAGLVTDAKDERAAQAHAELLVLVAVLGNHAVGVELDHAQGGPLAVNHAHVDAVPDPPQVERRQVVEGAHDDDPTSAQPRSGLSRSTNMCIRCREIQAPAPLGLCPVCAIQTRIEVSEGFRQLAQYLAAWAQFADWLAEHELVPAQSPSSR